MSLRKKHEMKYLLKRLESGWKVDQEPIEIRGADVFLSFQNGEEYLITTYGDSDYGSRMEAIMTRTFELDREFEDSVAVEAVGGVFDNLKKIFSI